MGGMNHRGENDVIPQIADFSREGVRRAVLREGLTHPLTLYPPAVAVLSGLAGLLFSYPPLLLVALGAGALGIGNGIFNVYLREQTIANRYLRGLAQKQSEHEKWILASLRENLEKGLHYRATHPFARRGLEQLDRSLEKFQNVEDVLTDKLRTTEVTYGRFQSAAKQVYLSVLDNLRTMAAVLKSTGTIDDRYIAAGLDALSRKTDRTAADQKETQALIERQHLLQSQLALVQELLANNEAAMTRLEETTSKLALMDTTGRLALTDLDTAIDDLKELAKNAHQYNTQPLILEKV